MDEIEYLESVRLRIIAIRLQVDSFLRHPVPVVMNRMQTVRRMSDDLTRWSEELEKKQEKLKTKYR